MKAEFMKLSTELEMDISFQEDSMYRRMRRLICFDMDSTLIETEVIDELAIRAGVGDQVKAITEAAMRGEIDFCESFRQRCALLKGLDVSVMQEIADRSDEAVEERLGHMVGLIEPLLVAVLSIMVGLILIAVMLPLMGVMSSMI